MLRFHFLQMTLKWLRQIHWQHRDTILAAFAVAHCDVQIPKIDFFDPVRYLRNLVFMYRLPQADFRYFSR